MIDNTIDEISEKAVPLEIIPADVSVPKLAKQLEAKTVYFNGIPESIRLECAWYLKNRGRSTSEAAIAIGVHEKKVQRYFLKKKKEIELKLDSNFQKGLVSNLMYSWDASRKRLLRLSDADNISIAEEH